VLARAWGIRVFPSTVLIASDGAVSSIVRGAVNWHGLVGARLIAPLLSGDAAGAVPVPGPAARR
jgi:hypothetical protein